MSAEPTRYPLAWPAHRPRRKASARVRGQFGELVDDSSRKSKPVSLATACARLEDQVGRLGGIYPLLSSNVELRMDGRPRADRGMPTDPGVCLYFHLKGAPYAMACDTYTEVAQNIAAIASHLEAMRRIERYGVATATETLQAFQALPPPPREVPRTPWWEVFGVSPETLDPEVIQAIYRVKARQAGTEPALLELNLAREEALAAINARAPKSLAG